MAYGDAACPIPELFTLASATHHEMFRHTGSSPDAVILGRALRTVPWKAAKCSWNKKRFEAFQPSSARERSQQSDAAAQADRPQLSKNALISSSRVVTWCTPGVVPESTTVPGQHKVSLGGFIGLAVVLSRLRGSSLSAEIA